jgi:regulator of sirC expression with transglutaminase-like and TPR domain
VLTRRLGIPITLAVVCMEVGRRAGMPIEGVGMPGQFLARPVGSDTLLDVFAGGVALTSADCEARYRALGGTGPFGQAGPEASSTATASALEPVGVGEHVGVPVAGGVAAPGCRTCRRTAASAAAPRTG